MLVSVYIWCPFGGTRNINPASSKCVFACLFLWRMPVPSDGTARNIKSALPLSCCFRSSTMSKSRAVERFFLFMEQPEIRGFRV